MTEQSKTEQELREKIALAFCIARREGLLDWLADGQAHAEEVLVFINHIVAAIKEAGYRLPDKAPLLTDEEIIYTFGG